MTGHGATLAINALDEHGIPNAANMGRFQYSRGMRLSGRQASCETQAWTPELGLRVLTHPPDGSDARYYYKARIYSPTLGRFLQTDPIGYADGK